MKVFVYRNLHKAKYSIKALDGRHKGKVIGYGNRLTMTQCQFKVSEPGRQRVLSSGHKNVHAGVVGHIISCEDLESRLPNTIDTKQTDIPFRGVQISYNPWKTGTFTTTKTRNSIRGAAYVTFRDDVVEAFCIMV